LHQRPLLGREVDDAPGGSKQVREDGERDGRVFLGGGDQDRAVGLKTGADRYFTKPFSFDELLPAVTELIGRARAGEAAAGGKTQP
jgi:DNA-binding response OmpR family regulator